MTSDKIQVIVGWSFIIGIVANTVMALNLNMRLNNLDYSVNQLDINLYSAIQSLSTEVYSIKSTKQKNRTGEFE